MQIDNHAKHEAPSVELGLVDLSDYGPLMTAEEAARELKFKSVSALRMACKRGNLALTPRKPKGRKECLYLTKEVEDLIKSWIKST